MSDVLAYALAYCQAGLSVVPWDAVHKTTTRKWKLGVVPPMTEAEIEDWWTYHPDDQVGILTGTPSGIVIVDADSEDAVPFLRSKGVPIDSTPWKTSTGRGYHFGFRAPEGVKIRKTVKLYGPGKPPVDICGEKAVAVMPPTLHRSGKHYEWLSDDFDLVELIDSLPVFDPAWFRPDFELVVSEQQETSTGSAHLDWETEDEGGLVMGAKRWLALAAPAVEGNGGDKHTFAVCASLYKDFGLTLKQAWALLLDWNKRCMPPWPETLLRRKLEEAAINGKNTRLQDDVVARAVLKDSDVVPEQSASRYTAPPVVAPTPTKPGSVLAALMANSSKAAAESAQHLAPAQTGSAGVPVTTDAEDEQFLRDVSAETAMDPGYVFKADILARCVQIQEAKPQLFYRFEKDIRLVTNSSAWKQAMRDELKKQRKKASAPQLGNAKDDKPDVRVDGDEGSIRDALVKLLAVEEGVYISASSLAFLAQDKRTGNDTMVDLEGGKLRNLLVNVCKPVQPSEKDGIIENRVVPIPANILQMLENLLPEQRDQFREVTRLIKAPFFLPSGEMVSKPGFDETTGTLVSSCPEVDLDRFPTVESAVAYLRDLFSDFPFATDAEFANYIGALLTPMCRSMYGGPTPWLLLEANSPSSGKSLLAGLIQVIYGYVASGITLPRTEEAIEKLLLPLLVGGAPIICFDNVKHMVDSALLELLGTQGGVYEGRVLGASKTRRCLINQLFVLTSNNATMSKDASRRFLRVRLVKQSTVQTHTGKQRFKYPLIMEHVQKNRGEILAALCRLVQNWVHREDKSLDADVPLIETFERFSATVGGICYAAGLTQWAGNFAESMAAFSSHDELAAFVIAWWDRYKQGERRTRSVGAAELAQLAQNEQLLGHWKGGDQAERTFVFQRNLGGRRDSVTAGFVIRQEENQKTHRPVFYLERETDAFGQVVEG